MTANPTITPNDARLLGPIDHTRIDVDAPAEMLGTIQRVAVTRVIVVTGVMAATECEHDEQRPAHGITLQASGRY